MTEQRTITIMKSKDEGTAPMLIAVSSLLVGTATVSVATRLYTRKKLARKSFRADDWLISAATFFLFAYLLTNCIGVNWGIGKHSSDGLTQLDITSVLKITYFAKPFYIFAAGLTKISVLVFLAHLNPYKSIALCIKALIIATSAYIVIGTICVLLECIPISISFNLAKLMSNTQPSACMNVYALAWAIPVVNSFLDFLVWTLPVKIIWHVRVTLRQRLAMMMLMCMGLTYFSFNFWLYVDVVIWTSAEITTTIFCSCCPALKMLFTHHFCKPTLEIQQTHSEDAINFDDISRQPQTSGFSREIYINEFMYNPAQAPKWSTFSSQ
ncbi:hypothetical protein RUND412_009464 [Rhizina undulata]